MRAPDGARPAASVAPPMPEPMMTMSGDGHGQAMRSSVSRIEGHGLLHVDGEGEGLAGADIGVGAHARDDVLAAERA